MPLPTKVGTPLELSDLPFWWERTTAPTTPFSLGIGVTLNVQPNGLHIHALREGTSADVDERLTLEKDEILGVQMFLMPDVHDEASVSWREAESSWVIVRHRDPFGVEPYFESVFTSEKAYWPKALAKLLKERAGIEPTIVEEDPKKRKRRLGHESSSDW